MQSETVEYRSTKEIIEGIVKNSQTFTNYPNDVLFLNGKMFLVILIDNQVYEVKVSHKRERLAEFNGKSNADSNKQIFLEQLEKVLHILFKKISFHDGIIAISDYYRDYTISLIKKKTLQWRR